MSKTINLSKARRERIVERKNSIKKRTCAKANKLHMLEYVTYVQLLNKKISQIKKLLKELEELV